MSDQEQDSATQKATMRKVMLRVLPFLALAYLFAGLDRVNVGFAALHMNAQVGISPYIYGLGAGIFFISYCLFAVPCNLMMMKVGPRKWLGIVMVSWGVVSASMALTNGPTSFLVLRFLLGVTEAGFFPGVMLFLTFWIPSEYRGRVVAMFMLALPISNFVGSPLSAALLALDGWMGMAGWHWMFIIEAVPAVIMGCCITKFLPPTARDADWLTPAEKEWIAANTSDPSDKPQGEKSKVSFVEVVKTTWVIPLSLIYFAGTSVNNAVVLWQPQILKGFALMDIQVGMLNAIPFAVGALFMIVWGRSSDRHSERFWHIGLPLLAATLALAASTLFFQLYPLLVILTIVIASSYGFLGPFWALVTKLIPPAAAPIAIGLINSVNSLGNFGATWIIGAIKEKTNSFETALLPLVLFVGMGLFFVVFLKYKTRKASAVQLSPP